MRSNGEGMPTDLATSCSCDFAGSESASCTEASICSPCFFGRSSCVLGIWYSSETGVEGSESGVEEPRS